MNCSCPAGASPATTLRRGQFYGTGSIEPSRGENCQIPTVALCVLLLRVRGHIICGDEEVKVPEIDVMRRKVRLQIAGNAASRDHTLCEVLNFTLSLLFSFNPDSANNASSPE